MFVHNRVQLIHHSIRELVDGEEIIPLYHVDGDSNVADMVTKPRRIQIADVDRDSVWMTGLPWMRLPTENLPRNQYGLELRPEDETLMSLEQFPNISVHLTSVEGRDMLLRTPSMAQAVPHGSSYFTDNQHRSRPLWLLRKIDFIYLGWAKACARLNLVCRAVLLIVHRRHVNDCNPVLNCAVCNDRLNVRASSLVDTAIQSAASTEVSRALGSSLMEKQFVQQDGIWYATQQLQKEGSPDVHDLDFQSFYDAVL
jgi:hypothetical protein